MILYVLRYYPTLSETFVYREIAELQRRGRSIAVAALGERADGALQDELPDVPVLRAPRLPLTPPPSADLWWLARRQRVVRALRAGWMARRARSLGVRRVHVHFAGEAAETGLVIARALGVPFSVTTHAVDLFRPRPSLPRVLREARPVLTVAEHHRRHLADRWGVEATVVRMGVDPLRFAPADPTPGARLRVVCVARYAPKKGVDALVRAVGADPHLELRLVCDAPHLGSPRVRVGALPPSRVPAALREAHVFALPCVVAPDGDRDGVPVALLEAMACGLPVITSAVAGIPEIVDDTVGWLLPPGDEAALREALRAARDPAERARRGRAARERILHRRLTVEAQVDALLAAWGEA